MNSFIAELGQAAHLVLSNTRKMVHQGRSSQQIDSYLRDCRECILVATYEAESSFQTEELADIRRALRHAQPNAELLGILAVLATVSNQHAVVSDNFSRFSTSAQHRVRSEVRDHTRLGVCDSNDIRFGAELALSSLQPLSSAA